MHVLMELIILPQLIRSCPYFSYGYIHIRVCLSLIWIVVVDWSDGLSGLLMWHRSYTSNSPIGALVRCGRHCVAFNEFFLKSPAAQFILRQFIRSPAMKYCC